MRRIIIGACVVQTGLVFGLMLWEPWLSLVALGGLGTLAVGLMPE